MTERHVACPACQASFRIAAGNQAAVACPRCQTQFVVPAEYQLQPTATAKPVPEYQAPQHHTQQTPLGANPQGTPGYGYAAQSAAGQPVQTSPGGSNQRLMIVLCCGGLAVGLLGVLVAGIAMYFALRNDTEGHAQPDSKGVAERKQANVSEPAAPVRAQKPVIEDVPSGQPEERNPAPVEPTVTAKERLSQPVPAARPNVRLKYGWNTGDEHVYKITVKAEIGSEKKQINAYCNYTVGEPALAGFQEEPATGTGFVVAPDGYLLTCAHVIEDAEKIEVSLDGKNFDAQVIDSDFGQDLALIHITAQSLQTLPLANSDRVQLAQDVRAVGFPLSNVLGTNVKVTSGSVSGITQDVQGKRFQIDASVNPGNSGGPVIDARGQVIGVASAKLMGINVSQVAFAVPSNQALELLRRNNIAAPSVASSEARSGPDLADAVKPSIAFIKVTANSNRHRHNVKYSGGYTSNIQVGSSSRGLGPRGRFGPPIGVPIRTRSASGSDSGALRISEFGEISQLQSRDQLPLALGPVALLAIENVNNHGQSSWGTETQSALNILERSSQDNFPFGPRFMPRDPFNPFGSRPQDKVKNSYPAVERVRYRLEKDGEEEAVLNKNYEFRTLEDSKNPYMWIKGSGQVVFDKKVGVPKSLDYNGTIQISSDNTTLKIPINLTYVLRDPVKVAEERRKAQEESERHRAEAEEAARIAATVPNPEKVAALIAEIKKSNPAFAYRHLDEISKLAVVEEHREEVIELAKQQLAGSNPFGQRSAVRVIGSWGSENERVSILSELLSEDDNKRSSLVRSTVIETLGKCEDPEVANRLASLLANFRYRRDAQKALIAMGPVAEDAVLEVLNLSDDHRRTAAEILEQIGTEKSIPALEKAEQSERSSITRSALERAREAIHRRQ